MRFTLHITGPYGSKTVTVENELSIGRTELASVVLDDSGLSRVNTTFFVDDGELLVADENSTNGTFLNGERIEGRPRVLRDGDVLKIGTYTNIRVETASGSAADADAHAGTATRGHRIDHRTGGHGCAADPDSVRAAGAARCAGYRPHRRRR